MGTRDPREGDRRRRRSRRRDGGFRPVAGLTVGLAAWLVGYAASLAATVAFFAGGRRPGPDGPVALLRTAGWVFYNGHFVPLDGVELDSVVRAGGGVLLSVLVVVPVVVAVGGAVLARGRRGAGAAGASLVVGYGPATLVGIPATSGELVGATAVPSALVATVVMAVGYPVVLGAAGGRLVARFDPETGRSGPDPDRERGPRDPDDWRL
jgi:hypothetical protein